MAAQDQRSADDPLGEKAILPGVSGPAASLAWRLRSQVVDFFDRHTAIQLFACLADASAEEKLIESGTYCQNARARALRRRGARGTARSSDRSDGDADLDLKGAKPGHSTAISAGFADGERSCQSTAARRRRRD